MISEKDVAPSSDGDVTGAEPPPRVVVDQLSISKLDGASLDYHSELKGSAFVVVGNSLVDQSCACAMSFSLKRPKKQATTTTSSSYSTSAHATGEQSGSAMPIATESTTAGSRNVVASGARQITRRSTNAAPQGAS